MIYALTDEAASAKHIPGMHPAKTTERQLTDETAMHGDASSEEASSWEGPVDSQNHRTMSHPRRPSRMHKEKEERKEAKAPGTILKNT